MTTRDKLLTEYHRLRDLLVRSQPGYGPEFMVYDAKSAVSDAALRFDIDFMREQLGE